MPQTAQTIASGHGWRVSDVVCTDGPHDPRFEEQHDSICIAVVLDGAFRYRSAHGEALLAPGTLLLGNLGQSFECGHDHSTGDRCLCFNFTPEYLESVLAGVPGVKHADFRAPKLPPSPRLIPLVSTGLAAARAADAPILEEMAVRLAGYAAARQADVAPALCILPHEERIITESLRLIENELSDLSGKTLSLSALSQRFALSPYRFLRLFHRMVGMTPHQYVLHLRLGRAALRLLTGEDEISAIAFDEGFGDLSTFNRRFRTLIGKTPSQFRVTAVP